MLSNIGDFHNHGRHLSQGHFDLFLPGFHHGWSRRSGNQDGFEVTRAHFGTQIFERGNAKWQNQGTRVTGNLQNSLSGWVYLADLTLN